MILRILAWLGIGVVVLAVFTAGAFAWFIYTPAPAPPQLSGSWSEGEIAHDGRQRTYRVYTPAAFTPGAPLVIVLHSSDGDVGPIRRSTGFGFERLADAHGFAVAYPRGFEGNWNACNRIGDYSANALNVDDVGFITAMIDELAGAIGADSNRVFAVGLSRGGHMAFRLALEAPSRFRAVAAVAASLPTEGNFKCGTPGNDIPSVMIMNGTADPLNPFEGGRVRLFGLFDRGTVISSMATAQHFADLAGAPGPERIVRDFDGVRVEQARWRGAGTEILLSAVQGGGHVMPQPYARNPRLLGRTPREIDGPSEIWAFFARQS